MRTSLNYFAENINQIGVELAAPVEAKVLQPVRDGSVGAAVVPGAGHGAEYVHDAQSPRLQGDGRAFQPIGISGSVVVFRVMPDRFGDDGVGKSPPDQQVRPQRRICPDFKPFVIRQEVLFQEEVIVQQQFPDAAPEGGLLEAPSFGIPTVNVGDRQRGRVRAVLVDVEQYQDLIDELEDLRDACDPELQRAFAEGAALAKDVDGAIARGDLVPFERAAQELGFDPHDLGEGESNGSDLHG